MTKADFVEIVARKNRLTKKATAKLLRFTFALIVTVTEADGRFQWPGFGVFSIRRRKARVILNPQTHERMKLPKSRTLGFKCAKEVRAVL